MHCQIYRLHGEINNCVKFGKRQNINGARQAIYSLTILKLKVVKLFIWLKTSALLKLCILPSPAVFICNFTSFRSGQIIDHMVYAYSNKCIDTWRNITCMVNRYGPKCYIFPRVRFPNMDCVLKSINSIKRIPKSFSC